MKITAIITLFCLSLPSVGLGMDCREVAEAVSFEMENRVAAKWFRKKSLQKRLESARDAIERQVKIECARACTPDDVRRGVARAVDYVLHGHEAARTTWSSYGLLIGALTVQSLLTAGIVWYDLKGIKLALASGYVSVIGAYFLNAFGGPLSRRLQNVANIFSWRAQATRDPHLVNPEEQRYEAMSYAGSVALSQEGQQGRWNTRPQLAILTGVLGAASTHMLLGRTSQDPDAGLKDAAGAIATFLVDAHIRLTEMDFTDAEFSTYALGLFTRPHLNRRNYDRFMGYLMEEVRAAKLSAERFAQVERAAHSWFPNPIIAELREAAESGLAALEYPDSPGGSDTGIVQNLRDRSQNNVGPPEDNVDLGPLNDGVMLWGQVLNFRR